LAEATVLVEEAVECLWKPDGEDALVYLRGRGLNDEAIRAAGLGFTQGIHLVTGSGEVRRSGIVIPWSDTGRLTLVKIRQLEGVRPKYVEVYRHEPGLYPSRSVIRPGRPLVIVEGELDALLLGQLHGDLASVVTLGSASAMPNYEILGAMLPGTPWYIATDNDPAGERAAQRFLDRWRRVRRVRPPGTFKDWTEVRSAGVNLSRWWEERLAGNLSPTLFTWEELSRLRWGHAQDEDAAAEEPLDDCDIAERLAIQQENG
jgi:hypothetical protein